MSGNGSPGSTTVEYRLVPSPGQAFDQHCRIAAVAVEAEQRLIDQNHLDAFAATGLLNLNLPILRSRWKGVYVAITSTGSGGL